MDPSVAVVIPPAAAAAEVPVVVAELEDEAAFFFGSALIGNANNANKNNEIIRCHEIRIKFMIERTSSANIE
jgi:hypothetical protein